MEHKSAKAEAKPKEFLQTSNVDLSPECFPKPVFDRKTVTPKVDPTTNTQEDPITYWTAPIIHKTKGVDGKIRTDSKFEVEGPILTSEGGIVVKKKGGRYLASVWVS